MSKVRTASPARDEAPASVWRRMRTAVLVLPLLYLIAMAGGWLTTARTGDDGIICAVSGTVLPSDCLVKQVAAGSPADRAGIYPGDDVVSTDGALFVPPDGVLRWFYRVSAGEPVQLSVRRSTPGTASSTSSVESVPIVLGSRIATPGVVVALGFTLLGGLLYLAVAIVVVRARPDDPAARLLFLLGVVGATSFVVAGFQYGGARNPPWGTWYWWAFFVLGILLVALQFHLFLAFPSPSPFLNRLRSLGPGWLRMIGGGELILYLPVLVAFEATPARAPLLQDAIVLLMQAMSILTLVVSYRRARTALARAQLRWPMCAFVVFAAVLFLGPLLQTATGRELLPSSATQSVLGLVPLSIGVAILRYRLFDIDIVINRALVYTLLTASLALVYSVGVVTLQQVFRVLTGQGSDLAIVASTLVIAALFQPLRRRIQVLIDRRFYRRKYDAVQILAAFSNAARDEVELSQLSSHLAHVVEETMQPSHLSLWLRERTDSRP